MTPLWLIGWTCVFTYFAIEGAIRLISWHDARTPCPQCRAVADADAAVERVVAEWRAEIEREVGAR